MNTSAALQDLQDIHDQLATIERDLTNYPPDLAVIHDRLTRAAARAAEIGKRIEELTTKAEGARRRLEESQKLEAQAKAQLKASTQGVQYQARLQEVFAREKATASAQKQVRDPLAQLEALQAETAQLAQRQAEDQAAFDERHVVFLGLHENQVVARGRLEARRTEREGLLTPAEVARFKRLLQMRQGRAVVQTEGGICCGCHTKVRATLFTQLREQGLATCDTCQRYLVPGGKA